METIHVVTIRCKVTDSAALRLAALTLARNANISESEFLHYESMTDDKEAYYLAWYFDHGSPLEHGIQIEQSNAELE